MIHLVNSSNLATLNILYTCCNPSSQRGISSYPSLQPAPQVHYNARENQHFLTNQNTKVAYNEFGLSTSFIGSNTPIKNTVNSSEYLSCLRNYLVTFEGKISTVCLVFKIIVLVKVAVSNTTLASLTQHHRRASTGSVYIHLTLALDGLTSHSTTQHQDIGLPASLHYTLVVVTPDPHCSRLPTTDLQASSP